MSHKKKPNDIDRPESIGEVLWRRDLFSYPLNVILSLVASVNPSFRRQRQRNKSVLLQSFNLRSVIFMGKKLSRISVLFLGRYYAVCHCPLKNVWFINLADDLSRAWRLSCIDKCFWGAGGGGCADCTVQQGLLPLCAMQESAGREIIGAWKAFYHIS